MSQRRRGNWAERLPITRGALIVLGLEIGLSLVWLMSDPDGKISLSQYALATTDNVWHEQRFWTLATSIFLEDQFISLLLHGFVMWQFVPVLERFWGTPRFFRFFAVTSLAGTLGGTLMGLATGRGMVAIAGLDPFIYASITAFGIVYAKQPVQFFGVLPLTGRQLMLGFIGFLVLFIGLQQLWETGAAFAAAMGAGAMMVSKKWSPGLVWNRWRIRRARAKLSVIDGGKGPSPKARDEQKWLN